MVIEIESENGIFQMYGNDGVRPCAIPVYQVYTSTLLGDLQCALWKFYQFYVDMYLRHIATMWG